MNDERPELYRLEIFDYRAAEKQNEIGPSRAKRVILKRASQQPPAEFSSSRKNLRYASELRKNAIVGVGRVQPAERPAEKLSMVLSKN